MFVVVLELEDLHPLSAHTIRVPFFALFPSQTHITEVSTSAMTR